MPAALGSKTQLPALQEGVDYTAVPVPLLDATTANTDIVAHISLLFPSRLSLAHLERSWYAVQDAWPIVAARVRRSSTAASGLEYQLPTPRRFETLRRESKTLDPTLRDFYAIDLRGVKIGAYSPGVASSSSATSSSSSAAADASAAMGPIAQNTTAPFLSSAAPACLETTLTTLNAVATFSSLLTSDRPIFTVQVVTFTDATMCTITLSHVVGDGFALRKVVGAWSDAIHGREIEPLKDLGVDPFAHFAPPRAPTEGKRTKEEKHLIPPPLPPGWSVYGAWDKARFVTNFLVDTKWKRPEATIEQRYIFLPDAFVRHLERTAAQDLGKAARVGRSAVLFAWVMQNNHAGVPDKTLCTPLTIANARGRPPRGMDARSAFPSNNFYNAALTVALPSFSAGSMRALSLGQLAQHVAQGIVERTTPEHAENSIRSQLWNAAWMKRREGSDQMTFFAPPNHRWSGLSDWRAIRFGNVDFSAAVEEKQRGGAEGNEKGGAGMIYAINANMTTPMTKRDRWIVFGEFHGGVWIVGYASKKEWEHPEGYGRFKQFLATDDGQEAHEIEKIAKEIVQKDRQGTRSSKL